MNNYCINQNDNISNRINSDIDKIALYLNNNIDCIESLVLAGGFGRGEGSVLVDKDRIQPINDYDIYIIVNSKIDRSRINIFRNYLSDEISIRQIDLDIIHIRELQRLKFTMANYDLKYASYVFYGNKSILDLIPDMDRCRMPLAEAITPLLLYLIAIIQAYPFSDLKKVSKNRIFWIFQQLSKSILGWSSALLIKEGAYHHSYIQRCKKFNELFSDNELRCSLVQKATQFKLEPYTEIDINIEEYWYNVSRVHMEVLWEMMCEYYNISFSSWRQIIMRYKYDYNNIIRRLFGIITNHPKYKNRIIITSAEIALCAAILYEQVDLDLLELSKNELKKLNTLQEDSNSISDIINIIILNDPNCGIFQRGGERIFYS